MKNLFAILTIIVAFVSCSDKVGDWRPAAELRTAHDLMQKQPDSALKVLISFDLNEKANVVEMHEYQILVAEALYKNYYLQTNDAAVVAAAAYYDSIFEIYPKNKDLAFETARAHYYKAVAETEKDNIIALCEDYLEAADIMEAAFPKIGEAEEKENITDGIYEKARFIGLIYNNLGIVLFNEQLPNLAAKMFKLAIMYFKSINDTTSVKASISNLAKSYVLCNKYDYAVSAFDELLKDTIPSATIIGDMAILDYNRSKSDESLNSIKTVINNIESKSERKRFEFALAEIYYDRQEVDSAITYYTRSIDRNKYTMMRASECLGNIYKSLNYNEKSIYYDSIYKSIASTEIERNIDRQDISTMVENFAAELQAKAIVSKRTTFYAISAIFLSAAALIVIISHIIRVKKMKARESILKTKIEEARNEARKSELELITLRNVETKKSDMVQKLCSLNITEDFETMKRKLGESDICKSLKSRFLNDKVQTKNIEDHRHLAMTKNEINDLMITADRCLPMFTTILSNLGVNNGNQPYCILQMLNFSTAEIAVLMNSSYSAVAKRIDSIRKNLKPEKGIVDFLNDYCSDIYKASHCN